MLDQRELQPNTTEISKASVSPEGAPADRAKSAKEQRLALEKKHAPDVAFNPLVGIQIEQRKHEAEIANLESKKKRVFNEPILDAVSGVDPMAAKKTGYDRQIAEQRTQAEWFASAVQEAQRGDVRKAMQYMTSIEVRVAENLRDAFKDEQEARAKLNGLSGAEVADIQRVTEVYTAAAKELQHQRVKIDRVQDQKRYLEALAEEKRGAN